MKKICVVLSAMGISLGSILFTQTEANIEVSTIEKAREFDFYNSLIFQNGDTKEVYLKAVINTEDYDLELMFEKVKEEYFLINGKADKLVLKLYDNVDSLKSGDCLGEKKYSN